MAPSHDDEFNVSDIYGDGDGGADDEVSRLELPPPYKPDFVSDMYTGTLSSGRQFQLAQSSERGYGRDKPNEDACCIHTGVLNPDDLLLAIFDGHGLPDDYSNGAKCAQFARDVLLEALFDVYGEYGHKYIGMHVILSETLRKVDQMLSENEDIDDSMAGTTAVLLYVDGNEGCTAWVGDSRAVL